MGRRRAPLDELPLFATDSELGPAILGARAEMWPTTATLLELRGLPKIDVVMGGRYVPAVRRFFDVDQGLAGGPLPAPDGVEDLGAWKRTRRRPA